MKLRNPRKIKKIITSRKYRHKTKRSEQFLNRWHKFWDKLDSQIYFQTHFGIKLKEK